MKKATLNLIDCRSLIGKYPQYKTNDKAFKIKTMKNTVHYRIGQHICKEEVQTLIDEGWTLNIVENMEVN